MGDSPKEAKNTIRSRATARVLDLVGEGQAQLVNGDSSIFLEKTKLENPNGKRNFNGVRTFKRTGTKNQTYISGFRAAENEINIGVQLTKAGGDIIRTITDTDADAFVAKIRINGLSKTNQKNGNIDKTRVEVSVYRKNFGGAYVKVHSFKFNEKTNSPFEAQKRIDLPAGTGPWDIKFARETNDSSSSYLRNDTFVTSYTLVYDAKLAYPYSALIGMEIDAKKFGSSFPDRRFEMMRIDAPYPSNWNPTTRIYTGIWDGTFLTGTHDNPAWYLWELMTNDIFGLGDLIASTKINKWNLYTIAQYCDGLINGKPRFTFNVQVMTRVKALQLLDSIASVFRGMIYWSAGAVDFAQDRPGSPTIDVSAANVIDGIFHRVQSGRKARHSSVTVAWNNPQLLGDLDYVYVPGDRLEQKFGSRPKEVAAFGCTDEDEARRVGEWILDTEEHEYEVISWKASLDHLNVVPGVKARVFDPAEQGARFAGRIMAFVDNVWTFANDFTNAVWFKSNCTVTGNVVNDWRGDPLADKLIEGAVSAIHQMTRNAPVALVNGDQVIFSYMVQAAGRTRARIQLTDNTLYAMTYDVDLTTGAVLFNPVANAGWSNPVWSVIDYGGGWWWISLGGIKVGSDPDGIGSIQIMNGGSNNYLGDGVSGFYIAHGQYEYKPAAGIPTEFAAIKIDDPAGIAPASYDLNVMCADGSISSKPVTRHTDSNMYLHVGSRYTVNPQLEAMWSVTSVSITGEICYVTGVFERAANIWEVQAIVTDPTKYARIERGVTIEHPPYSTILSGQLAPPEQMTVTEYFVYSNNDYITNVMINWLAPNDPRVTIYEYQWATGTDSDFNEPVQDDVLSFELENVSEGILRIQVRSVAREGVILVPSDWQLIEVSIMGANAKPADITNARVNSDGSIATVKWDRATDALTNSYEVRFTPLLTGQTWDGATVVAANISKRSAECATVSRIGTFMVKGVSSNGKYSVTAAKVVCRSDASDSVYGGEIDESADWFGLGEQSLGIMGNSTTGYYTDTTRWTLLNMQLGPPLNERETAVNGAHTLTSKVYEISAKDHVKYTHSYTPVGGRNTRHRIEDQLGNFVEADFNGTTFTVVSTSSSGFTGVTSAGTNLGGGVARLVLEFDTLETSATLKVTVTMLNGTSASYLGVITAGFNQTEHTVLITNKQMIENGSGELELAPASDYRTSGYYLFANSVSTDMSDPSLALPKQSVVRFQAKFEYVVTDDGGVIGDLAAIGDASAIGGNSDGITITPQLRSANYAPGPILYPPDYGDWEDLTDALFTGKGFQFRFFVTSTNPLITPQIASAVIKWEVPNYVESDFNISSGTGSPKVITFEREFLQIPSVQITPADMNTGNYFRVTNLTTTGFEVQFFNSTITVINRTFDWTATGFGPVIP